MTESNSSDRIVHRTNLGSNARYRQVKGKRFLPYDAERIGTFPCRLVATLVAAVVLATCVIYKHHSSIVTMSEMQLKNQHATTHPFGKRQSLAVASHRNRLRAVNAYNKEIRASLAIETWVANKPNNKPMQLRLRYDWTNLSPSLDLTKEILRHQSNCSIPVSTFAYRNRFGLGSDLHIYAQALGNGIETNRRIRTVGNWTWMDQSKCGNDLSETNESEKKGSAHFDPFLGSPMRCYFATSELNCPGDVEYAIANPEFDPEHSLSKPNGNVIVPKEDFVSKILPSKKNGGEQLLQTAVVESLFLHMEPLVVDEAERQLNIVFGGKDEVPSDLITVHIRWGDKIQTYQGEKRKRRAEMKKVEISEYIEAVNQILDKRETLAESTRQKSSVRTNRIANIYLATEDPEAVEVFSKALPAGWNLFVDQFLVDTSRHRIDEYNGLPKMAKALNGKAGLLALGSLLVAMEANDFVLTTASNWSRLMNELRQSILDPRCSNCTTMLDLRPS